MSDARGEFYASNILAAYDYAFQMGAHIVSNSFGPSSPNYNPTPYERSEDANRNRIYEMAVRPLMEKEVLLVAAAGGFLSFDPCPNLEATGYATISFLSA